MTVYVVQQPVPNRKNWVPDLTPANEFGAIEYVFKSDDNVYALPGPMMKKAQKIFKDFDPNNDYLLWPNTGDPAALWTCCFALAILGFDKISILYWNRKRISGQRDYQQGFYVPITYDLKQMI